MEGSGWEQLTPLSSKDVNLLCSFSMSFSFSRLPPFTKGDLPDKRLEAAAKLKPSPSPMGAIITDGCSEVEPLRGDSFSFHPLYQKKGFDPTRFEKNSLSFFFSPSRFTRCEARKREKRITKEKRTHSLHQR